MQSIWNRRSWLPPRHGRQGGRLLVLVLLIGFIGGVLLTLHRTERAPVTTPAPSLAVTTALGGEAHAGYQRAEQPRPFQFPADHGPHPTFRNEWWYLTGNLADATGRAFGYQFTLFRIALTPDAPPTDSPWRTRHLYMAHFALTDVTGQRHLSFERFSREALGLAGAQAEPFRVWLEDWSLHGTPTHFFPLHLRVREGDLRLDLTLSTGKPLVMQGDRGLSQKSAEPGNASYYYSYTRLPTAGSVQLQGQQFTVNGSSWLDREWSTSALGPQQTGWDWFALQLDDGRDLMFYRLRHQDGSMDRFSSGILVATDGQVRRLSGDQVELKPLTDWTSPVTGDRYPAAWQLRLPADALDLTITPKLADQEMRLTVRYWEGAVTVRGHSQGQPISGQGYLEMTRYHPR